MNTVLFLASLAALAGYVCRIDQLSWRAHPWAMLTHLAGGGGAAWALRQAGLGEVDPLALLALVGAAAWLLASFPVYAPAGQRSEPHDTVWPAVAERTTRKD